MEAISKFEDLDDDYPKTTIKNAPSFFGEPLLNIHIPDKNLNTEPQGLQTFLKEALWQMGEHEHLPFGSQLEQERIKYFSGLDFDSFNYPRTSKISKFLETKDYNFWAEGISMMDKVLHDQIESIEKEITHCTSMTFNR